MTPDAPPLGSESIEADPVEAWESAVETSLRDLVKAVEDLQRHQRIFEADMGRMKSEVVKLGGRVNALYKERQSMLAAAKAKR
jgi:hypothetical protein